MKDTLKKIGIALAMSAVTLASAQAAKWPERKTIEKKSKSNKSIATSSSKKNSLY